ncbi:MAG: DUF5398 family protein [Chlamydiae bacterium]|nr:DUF5398 family protein [Chlamydiota bacterium]
MFGLEEEKEKSALPAFDLEKDLMGPEKVQKLKEYKELIITRSESLKNALRTGENKEEFTTSEIVLNGYSALQQVIERITR